MLLMSKWTSLISWTYFPLVVYHVDSVKYLRWSKLLLLHVLKCCRPCIYRRCCCCCFCCCFYYHRGRLLFVVVVENWYFVVSVPPGYDVWGDQNTARGTNDGKWTKHDQPPDVVFLPKTTQLHQVQFLHIARAGSL